MITQSTFTAARATIEKTFAALASAAIITVIVAGTFSMCAPGVLQV